MIRNQIMRLGKVCVLVCALSLSVVLMMGCAAGEKAKTPAELNRAYMASVSQSIEDLGTELDSFVDAVGENDLAAMKIASERAGKAMEAVKNLTAPEAMTDVHSEYCAGIDALQSALSSYVDLYTQVEAGSISASDLKAQLSSVQKVYEDGIKHLEKGDSLVMTLAGADKDAATAQDSSASAE